MNSLLCAQSIQHGLVQEYRGTQTKQPLPNVSIAVANASPVSSGEHGEFTLTFRTLHAGDAIQYRRVELGGYEVMNTEALEAARVPRLDDSGSDDKPFVIVMARREELRRLRDGYRSVVAKRYEQQMQRVQGNLDSLRQAGQLAEELYAARMDSLEADYEERLSRLESYIDKFARIDLSDLDQEEQQIIALVQEGNLEEALHRYEAQNLSERLRRNRDDQSQLTAVRQQLAEAARRKAAENERLRQSIDRQITLLRMAGGEENYNRVYELLHETYLADTTAWEARKEYAQILCQRGAVKEAIALLEQGLTCERDTFAHGLLMIDLLRDYAMDGNMEQMMQQAVRLEEMMTPLLESHYWVRSRCLPVWADMQLRFYLQQDRIKECRPVVERLLAQWGPDTLSVQHSLRSYINLINELNDYFSIVDDREKALWCAREGMRLGEIMERKEAWISHYCLACAIACQTLLFQAQTEEGRSAARQALASLERRMQKGGTNAHYALAAKTCTQLMEALVPAGEYDLADSVMLFRRACRVDEYLLRHPDESTLSDCGLYRMQEVLLLLHKGEIAEAEGVLASTVTLLRGDEMGDYILEMMLNEVEAAVYLAKGQYPEALQRCERAIAVNAAAYEESKDAWSADNLCRTYLLLHDIHDVAGNRKEADKALKQARKVAAFPSNEKAIERRKVNN